MRVVLTFDVEIWCGSWSELDTRFPAAFERYVYGRSSAGDYALPKTLEILNRHGITGVFFVEPLFAVRFGLRYLEDIVRLIRSANQDVQLHLHPEWTDELTPLPFAGASVKRQHLYQYDLAEQSHLIGMGKAALEQAGGGNATVFRAGSYAANLDTYEALAQNGIYLDSSLNNCFEDSGPDIKRDPASNAALQIGDVQCIPVSSWRDAFGRARPAQVSAAGFHEISEAIMKSQAAGQEDFVIVSHNFEMLKRNSSLPDWVVVRRFERLCQFLADAKDRLDVGSFRVPKSVQVPAGTAARPSVGGAATAHRLVEQLMRRW